MPITILTNPDATLITGSCSITGDPSQPSGSASNGNLTVAGSVLASTMSVSGTLTAGSISAGGLNSSFTSGLTVSGGINYDMQVGGVPSVSTSSQSVSTSGATITMTTGSLNTIFVSAASTTATCVLTPTASASTSGLFQNGTEITMINLGAAGSNVLLPSTSMGSLGIYNYTLSGGHGAKFKYISALQTWIPLASA